MKFSEGLPPGCGRFRVVHTRTECLLLVLYAVAWEDGGRGAVSAVFSNLCDDATHCSRRYKAITDLLNLGKAAESVESAPRTGCFYKKTSPLW